MKPQIISREEIIEKDGNEDQVTRWYFSKDGIHEINLGNLLGERIMECDWLDEKETTLLVNYSDWASNSVYALVSQEGKVFRKSITFIEEYIEEHEVMIANIMGKSLGMENLHFNMDEDDRKVVVLDKRGRLILEPRYKEIGFIEERQCFYAITDYDQEQYFYPNGEENEMEMIRREKLMKLKRDFRHFKKSSFTFKNSLFLK
ncbi:hypothetical protein [Adhaeribacter soli]|uniref:WG repeat-containing protein n=1 Tax=Adhaeribacter soli TaxID=2607655 RepID=A0A5N1IXI2_9BACT|nr:hypothetical protein [Adhaeribacter soli]KAA9338798.1 hypothetical protein F0P94_08355 [Adhaeribacter soli]